MGAIDAHRIHALPGKIEHMIRRLRILGRKRHQDAAFSAFQRRPEQPLGIAEKVLFAAEELALGGKPRGCGEPAARHALKRRLDRIEHREDPALEPAQRGEAIAHERALQGADIVMPQGAIVGQVQGAGGK